MALRHACVAAVLSHVRTNNWSVTLQTVALWQRSLGSQHRTRETVAASNEPRCLAGATGTSGNTTTSSASVVQHSLWVGLQILNQKCKDNIAHQVTATMRGTTALCRALLQPCANLMQYSWEPRPPVRVCAAPCRHSVGFRVLRKTELCSPACTCVHRDRATRIPTCNCRCPVVIAG